MINENGIYCVFGCDRGDFVFSNFDHQRLNLGSISRVAIGKACLTLPKNRGEYGCFGDLVPDGMVAVCPRANKNRIIVYKPRVAREGYMDAVEMNWNEYLIDRTGSYLMDRTNCRIYDLVNERLLDLAGWNPITDYDDMAVSEEKKTITYLEENGIGIRSMDGELLYEIPLPIPDKASYDLNSITAMRVRSDGSTLVSIFDNDTLWCWVDGKAIEIPALGDALSLHTETLAPQFDGLYRVFTDGRFVVISSREPNDTDAFLICDTQKKAWRLMAGEQPARTVSINGIDRALCLSDSTGKLAYISEEGRLVVYDLQTGALEASFDLLFPSESVEDLLFIDHDRYVVCLANKQLVCHDLQTGSVRTCKYGHQFVDSAFVTDLSNISVDSARRRLYIGDAFGDNAGICIDIDSWTRIASIPYMIGYSQRSNELLIYDYPSRWHPNILNYDYRSVAEEGTFGICRIPALGVDDMNRLGREVLHSVHASDPADDSFAEE